MVVNVIHTEPLHFIAGTETWLNPSVYYSSEVFPPDYYDRPDGCGVAVFACHKTH